MADLNSTIVRGKLRVTEDINANGNITGSSIAGNGSGLTNLNASNIGSGTLSADRLATSGATAGSYGPSANATPAYGATFNVPYITVDNKGRVTKAETKTVKIPDNSNLVPYTGASKDVNLGNHSLFMSNKTGNTGNPTIKLSAKGLSEDDCYCEVSPTSIFIQDPGSTITYGDNYIDSNGIKIYLPGNNYIPAGSETFVLKSNLSTLLDKGTENSSMVTDQVIYNPVEMQKRLTLPSVGGRKIRIDGISGNEAPLFLLKGAASGNDHISALILSSLPIGATDISTLSATKIEQRAGSFTIQHKKYKTETDSMLSPVFGFNEDHG